MVELRCVLCGAVEGPIRRESPGPRSEQGILRIRKEMGLSPTSTSVRSGLVGASTLKPKWCRARNHIKGSSRETSIR